jgi:hypothetical protein
MCFPVSAKSSNSVKNTECLNPEGVFGSGLANQSAYISSAYKLGGVLITSDRDMKHLVMYWVSFS